MEILMYAASLLCILVRLYASAELGRSTQCRCLPSSDCWPNDASWDAFNFSLGGRLLRPHPPAAPCHVPGLDAAACQTAMRNWHNPFWRADQAGAMQYPNREADGDAGCILMSADPYTICYQGAVPAYAVEVSEPWQVQAAVGYAVEHNLRLTVKSTGHDILGRSTAPGSLNIWMHRLKKIAFYDSFRPQGCHHNVSEVPAVNAEAGVQWQELYEAADAQNRVVVGGMSASVSTAGGYLQGGGHSPLSPLLGLAADNILELKAVTADGRLVTANYCQNQDLFWALRGGGGGTFGVVVSATHKTFPAFSSVLGVRFSARAMTLASFEGLIAKFVELQSSLSDAGYWSGYSLISPMVISAIYLLPNCDAASTAITAFEPVTDYVNQRPGEMNFSQTNQAFPSFQAWHSFMLCKVNPGVCSDATGFNSAIASRLLPKAVLRENAAEVAGAFIQILSSGVGRITGHLVGGGAVAINQSNAVNPAWRKAVWHVVLVSTWDDSASAATTAAKMRILTETNGLLRDLTPGSGSYLNEADFNEPHWQTSFFGDNFDRLNLIKHQVDPDALFTCTKCVGSEDSIHDLHCLY